MVLQHILRSIFVLLAFQSVHIGPCDLMDKGSDFGSGDYRFESCHGQCLLVRNYDKALYILSLKLITTHTLSCNFNNTIELC